MKTKYIFLLLTLVAASPAGAEIEMTCSTAGTFNKLTKKETRSACPGGDEMKLNVNEDGTAFSNNCGLQSENAGYEVIIQTQKIQNQVEVTLYLDQNKLNSDEAQMNLLKPLDSFFLSSSRPILNRNYKTSLISEVENGVETRLENLNLKCSLTGIKTPGSRRFVASRRKI